MEKEKAFFPKVKDIAHMGVVQTSGSSTVAEAVRLMEASNLGDVVFETEAGHAIFTVEDLMLFSRDKRDLDLQLRELSVSLLSYVDGEESVLPLLSKFDEAHCRYLGVRDDQNNLIGIVSYTDILASVDPVLMIERKKLSEVVGKRRVEIVGLSTSTEVVLAQLVDAEDAVLVAEHGRLVGIMTTKDAVRLIKEGADIKAPVEKYMTSPVWTLSHTDTIKVAIDLLKEKKFKRAIVVDDDGKVLGVVTQRELVDITYGRWAELMKLHAHELGELVVMLQSANKKLQQETLTDPLTGVGNRRRINQVIESEIGRYYRQNMSPFSLLLLDIDHFKQVNDEYGHLAGDQVLKELCKKVLSLLRVTDEMARWGGEEFVVLLPTASADHAAVLAERIRTEIARGVTGGLNVTVSVGLAEYQRGESLETLVSRADQALYAAKNQGRNRVCRAD